MNEITTLKARKITYSTLISVHHWSGTNTNSVRIESEAPLGPFVAGDRLAIGGLDGFPESRLTMGTVREIQHTLSGDTLNLIHAIAIEVDEDRE